MPARDKTKRWCMNCEYVFDLRGFEANPQWETIKLTKKARHGLCVIFMGVVSLSAVDIHRISVGSSGCNLTGGAASGVPHMISKNLRDHE